jgi:hypothetical protein
MGHCQRLRGFHPLLSIGSSNRKPGFAILQIQCETGAQSAVGNIVDHLAANFHAVRFPDLAETFHQSSAPGESLVSEPGRPSTFIRDDPAVR